MAKKKATKDRKRLLEADVVRARSFELTDDKGRARAHLSLLNNTTVFQLMDKKGLPQISLDVNEDGFASVVLFDTENIPGISLAITKDGRGICITGPDGSMITTGQRPAGHGDPWGDAPNFSIFDQSKSRSWSVFPFDGQPPSELQDSGS